GKVLARENIPEQEFKPRVVGGEETVLPRRVDQKIVYESRAGNVAHGSEIDRCLGDPGGPVEFTAGGVSNHAAAGQRGISDRHAFFEERRAYGDVLGPPYRPVPTAQILTGLFEVDDLSR